jgi:hypothetical protein
LEDLKLNSQNVDVNSARNFSPEPNREKKDANVGAPPLQRPVRAAAPPPADKQGTGVGEPVRAPVDEGPVKVKISGIVVKSKYTTTELIKIFSDAFSAPFTTFIESTADHAVQIKHDRRLTKEERANLAKIGGALDRLASLAPTNGMTQMGGTMLGHVNNVIAGKMPTPEEMAGLVHTGVTSTDAKMPSSTKYRSKAGFDKLDLGSGGTVTTNFELNVPGLTKQQGGDSSQKPLPPIPSGINNLSGEPEAGQNSDPPAPVKQGSVATESRLNGAGPVNLEQPGNAGDEQRRFEQGSPRFTYYRNDKDVSDMQGAKPANAAQPEARNGVLTVGDGREATSYFPAANAYVGRSWLPTGEANGLQGTKIIKLGPGKDGVAAMKLNFDDLPRGSTTIVTGGPMQSSTMLFAADSKGFYAYHAGRESRGWPVAEKGARSIVDAHQRMTGRTVSSEASASPSNRENLVAAAKQYPFSALIYNGKYSTDPERKTSDARINVPEHAKGGDAQHPWQMTAFSYFMPDSYQQPTIGTAQAVISKDMNGKVSIVVQGERGELTRMEQLDNGATGFQYEKQGGAKAYYAVPPSA